MRSGALSAIIDTLPESILETVLRRFYFSYIEQIYPRELKAFRSFDRFENTSKLAVGCNWAS